MGGYGIPLKMVTAKHLQTHGATKIMNGMVENLLQCYCSRLQTDCNTLLTSAEFAYNSVKIISFVNSAFQLDLGWCPHSALDVLLQPSDFSVQSIEDLKQRLKASFDDALFAHRLAQERRAAYTIQNYTSPSYSVRDSVFLSRELSTDVPSA